MKIVIVHQPACSSVISYTKRLGSTILRQASKEVAKAFAQGLLQGNRRAVYHDEIDLPAGNPALLYDQAVKAESVMA